jgi:hypothetical protein
VSCETWNTNITTAAQLEKLEFIGNQSQTQLNSELPLKPMCKQNQECAGWGANPLTGPAKFNVVSLSFTDQTKTFEGMREPVEAQVTPVLDPQFGYSFETFPSITDFIQYTNSQFTAHSPPQGTNGIYGETFKSVLNSFFTRCGIHPTPFPQIVRCDSLSVASASLSIVGMRLPFDPVSDKYQFTLDRWAERAIQGLPPPPPPGSAHVDAWWGRHKEV